MPTRRLTGSRPLSTALAVCATAVATSVARADLTQHPQTVLEPRSELAQWLLDVFLTISWWEIGIFVVVSAALITAIVRFRARPGVEPQRDMHGHTMLEFGWTIAPAIILAFIAVPTVKTIFRSQAPAAADALQVEVIGHQWWWEFRYPQLGVVTANELVIPTGKTVNLSMTSADVLHSFWLPAFGAKRDVVPGRTNYIWFTPNKAGYYYGQCAELCGASHANMRMRALVKDSAEFDTWVADQKKPGLNITAAGDTLPREGLAAEGEKQFRGAAMCFTCHTVKGVSVGVVGPDLTHVKSRTTIAGGIMENTPENLAKWIKNAPAEKPGSLMPDLKLSDEQVQAVVAYLETLK